MENEVVGAERGHVNYVDVLTRQGVGNDIKKKEQLRSGLYCLGICYEDTEWRSFLSSNRLPYTLGRDGARLRSIHFGGVC